MLKINVYFLKNLTFSSSSPSPAFLAFSGTPELRTELIPDIFDPPYADSSSPAKNVRKNVNFPHCANYFVQFQKCTMWKFQDLTATLILREINFD